MNPGRVKDWQVVQKYRNGVRFAGVTGVANKNQTGRRKVVEMRIPARVYRASGTRGTQHKNLVRLVGAKRVAHKSQTGRREVVEMRIPARVQKASETRGTQHITRGMRSNRKRA